MTVPMGERRQLGAVSRPAWTGDLDDDCSSRWAGFLLRAEEMDEGFWWWAVYDEWADDPMRQVASSHDSSTACDSGSVARQAAEQAARGFLGL